MFQVSKEPLAAVDNNLPVGLLNVVSKRFNLLVVIAGSVLTALLIMVIGGFLIYRVAFGRNGENGNANKKSNFEALVFRMGV